MFPTVAATLGEVYSCARELCWRQLGLKPHKPCLLHVLWSVRILFEQTSYLSFCVWPWLTSHSFLIVKGLWKSLELWSCKKTWWLYCSKENVTVNNAFLHLHYRNTQNIIIFHFCFIGEEWQTCEDLGFCSVSSLIELLSSFLWYGQIPMCWFRKHICGRTMLCHSFARCVPSESER